MEPRKAKSVAALIDAAVRGELDQARMLRLCSDAPELITLALLGAGKRIAEQDARRTEQDARLNEQDARLAQLAGEGGNADSSPSTPSGMVPIYYSDTE